MTDKPQAVIFDMDGVIVDSEPWWLVAMDAVFNKAGVDLEPEDFRATTGLRLDEVVAYWYTQRDFSGYSEAEIVDHIYAEVLRLVTENSELMPGLVPLLSQLGTEDIPIGLASSSSQSLIQGVLSFFKIESYFDVVMSAEHFDYGKPHPEVFIQTAKKLGVSDHTRCIVIEDSINGILAARAARMPCVVMPDPQKKELMQFAIAQKMIHSLEDLQDNWYSELIY